VLEKNYAEMSVAELLDLRIEWRLSVEKIRSRESASWLAVVTLPIRLSPNGVE